MKTYILVNLKTGAVIDRFVDMWNVTSVRKLNSLCPKGKAATYRWRESKQ